MSLLHSTDSGRTWLDKKQPVDTKLWSDDDGFFDRSDAIVLLLLFCVFIYYTVSDGIRQRGKDANVEQANEHDEDTPPDDTPPANPPPKGRPNLRVVK